MRETGRILKETREGLNKSLHEVSAATKINLKILEGIEVGDIEHLPTKTFLRGFVRTYAAYLKLDTDTVMDTFQKEMGSTKYQPVLDKDKIESNPDQELPPTPLDIESRRTFTLKIVGLVVSVLLIAIIYGVLSIIKRYQNDAQSFSITSQTAESDNKNGQDTNNTQIDPNTQVPPKDAQKEASKDAAVIVEAAKPTAAVVPPAVQAPEVPKQQKVIVEALDNVEIEYQIDGGLKKTISLKPEQKYTFEAKSTVDLDISNGGAINVVHNGSDKGVPGNLGQRVKRKYP